MDSIRAAQRLTSALLPAAGLVALWGYSEGGMASGAAADLQTSYAPELQVKGAYVGASPANLQLLAPCPDGKPAAGVLLYMVNGMNAAYPKAGFLDMLNAAGRQRPRCLMNAGPDASPARPLANFDADQRRSPVQHIWPSNRLPQQ
ncbi:lipase family protein [Cupriavidus necator]|uniref:lipase family protein n=1 Tax=Cupriavidus necator TaxID=106590 RepID=UPI00339D69CF